MHIYTEIGISVYAGLPDRLQLRIISHLRVRIGPATFSTCQPAPCPLKCVVRRGWGYGTGVSIPCAHVHARARPLPAACAAACAIVCLKCVVRKGQGYGTCVRIACAHVHVPSPLHVPLPVPPRAQPRAACAVRARAFDCAMALVRAVVAADRTALSAGVTRSPRPLAPPASLR